MAQETSGQGSTEPRNAFVAAAKGIQHSADLERQSCGLLPTAVESPPIERQVGLRTIPPQLIERLRELTRKI
jgi:hypothetical protein